MTCRRTLSILLLIALLATSFVAASAQTVLAKDPETTLISGTEVTISGRVKITMTNKTNFIAILKLANPVNIQATGTSQVVPMSEIQDMIGRKTASENVKKKYNNKDFFVRGILDSADPLYYKTQFIINAPMGFRYPVLTAMKKPSSVSLSSTKESIANGATFQLTATVKPATALQLVTWSSSKKSVATVDANGLVTAKAKGTAYITAKAVNGKSKRCKVTVTIPANSIALNFSELTLDVGKKKTLKVSANPSGSNTKPYRWTTSNSNVATINKDGVVTAKASGYSTITVETADRTRFATCNVTVPGAGVGEDPKSFTVVMGLRNMLLAPNDTLPLDIRCNPVVAKKPTLTWHTSDSAVATVDANGVVTAKGYGVAAIEARATTLKASATSNRPMSATTTVVVTKYPNAVTQPTTTSMLQLKYQDKTIQLPMKFEGFSVLVPGGRTATDTAGAVYFQNDPANKINYAFRYNMGSGEFETFYTEVGDATFKTAAEVVGGDSYDKVIEMYGVPGLPLVELDYNADGSVKSYTCYLTYRIGTFDLIFRIDSTNQTINQIAIRKNT